MRNWLHVGFVQVDEQKMSKSLGNFFTIREVIAKYQPEVLRYFLLSSHYRSPINYTEQSLQQSKAALDRLYLALRDFPLPAKITRPRKITKTEEIYEHRFKAALDDDFNIPEALPVLFDLAHEINKNVNKAPKKALLLANILRRLGSILGLLETDPSEFLQGGGVADGRIEHLVAERDEARRAKNWAESDRLRAELEALGIVVEDSPKGTLWRKK